MGGEDKRVEKVGERHGGGEEAVAEGCCRGGRGEAVKEMVKPQLRARVRACVQAYVLSRHEYST